MNTAVFDTTSSAFRKVVPGASALTKVISSTTIVGSTDSSLALAATTETLLCQIKGDAVHLNLHAHATPSASNALQLPVNTIFNLSRSEWLNATWLRVTTDATIVAQQQRAS